MYITASCTISTNMLFQILYNTSYSFISRHHPPLQDLISAFAEYSCVQNMKFCFIHTYVQNTWKYILDLIHNNAPYCSECRASFCMEICKKYMCILSQWGNTYWGIWRVYRKCHITLRSWQKKNGLIMHLIECGFLQRDATNLNSPILAKDIKNSMTTIHTYSKSANGSSHNALYHKYYHALHTQHVSTWEC